MAGGGGHHVVADISIQLGQMIDIDAWKAGNGVENANIQFGYGYFLDGSFNAYSTLLVNLNESTGDSSNGFLTHDGFYVFSGTISIPGYVPPSCEQVPSIELMDSRLYLYGQMYDAEDSCATEFFFSVDKDTFAQYSTITFRYEAGT